MAKPTHPAPPQTPPGQTHTNIQIDRVHYKVAADSLTGQGLRELAAPPIPATRDLFLVVPGGEDDQIDLLEPVDLQNGMRFFTAPARINPGLSKEVDHAIARR